MAEDEEEGNSGKHLVPIHFQIDPNDSLTWEFNFGCSEANAKTRKLILLCVHGNEQCGLTAFNQLLDSGWIQQENDLLKKNNQRVKVILANPEGVIKNKRFIDLNLNRIFRAPFTEIANISPTNTSSSSDLFPHPPYELSRLSILMKAISWCDYLIDIHSTSAETPPFAICTEGSRSEKFATTFPVEYVIKDLSKLVSGTTLECAKEYSKVGICVECGEHSNPHSVEIATEVIKRFVSDVEESAHNVVSCAKSQLITRGFHFLKHLRAFQMVKYKEVLGEDEKGIISCPYPDGAIIIMPTENPIVGEEAWFWGEHSPLIEKAVQHQRE